MLTATTRDLLHVDGKHIRSTSISTASTVESIPHCDCHFDHTDININDHKSEKVKFSDQYAVIYNPAKCLTEEEHEACFVTPEDDQRMELERLRIAKKFELHKRNPARNKFDEATLGDCIRGLEDTLQIVETSKARIEHISNVLMEQKRVRSLKTYTGKDCGKISACLARASKETSKKSKKDALSRAKKDSASGYYKPTVMDKFRTLLI